MRLERLTLRYFRNYRDTSVTFTPGGAYITGANGSGKTNLLEAIYFLANQTSFRTTSRDELQGWGATQCMIGALVVERATQRQHELAVHVSARGRRLLINGKGTRDLQKFATLFAAVAFHPGTLNVIKGSPGGRRLLIDRGIASLQPAYAHMSQEYQRLLKQRNALLRASLGETHATAKATLAVWTERFIDAAVRITQARQAHIALLNRTLAELVQSLGIAMDALVLSYCPAALTRYTPTENAGLLVTEDNTTLWRARFLAEAQRLQRAEAALGQTLFGPQRDDVTICYRGRESRSYASQGEQRLSAFLLVAALALAIQQQRGYRPVVLLDDVVSELDERNRRIIFDFLQAHAFQVFITDVEEREFSSRPSALASVHVRQVDGHAALQHAPHCSDASCVAC